MSLHTLENIRMRGDQEPVTQFTTRIFFVFAGDVKCQHRRAVTYFTESIRQSCPMIGVSCPSYGEFIDVSFLFRHWFQNGTIGMLCVSLSYYTYILWPNANTMKGLHFYNMLLYLTGWLLGLRRWTPLFIHGLGRRASALTTPANQALSTYMGTQPILWYVPYHYRRETQIYFYVLHYMLLLFSRFFFQPYRDEIVFLFSQATTTVWLWNSATPRKHRRKWESLASSTSDSPVIRTSHHPSNCLKSE